MLPGMVIASLAAAAAAHHRAGRLGPAWDGYRRLLAAAPGSMGALFSAGICAGQRGDPAAAVRLMDWGLRCGGGGGADAPLRGNLAHAYRHLGRVRLDQGDTAGAATAFARAVALAPDEPAPLGDLIQAREGAGDIAGTAAVLRRAMAFDPASATVFCKYAQVLGKLADYAGVMGAARRALRLAPEMVDPASYLGAALCSLHRAGEAQAWLRRAVVTRPGALTPHLELSRALTILGRRAGALDAVERALILAPGQADVMALRFITLLQWEDYARGWAAYEERAVWGAPPTLHSHPPVGRPGA
jgi:tetratricopeptide (TPR) repeat protein